MKLKKLLLVSGLAFAMPVSLISLSIASSLERKEPVRAHAADVPSAANVSLNGVSFASGGSNYFKNGDTDTFTAGVDDYNAMYDDISGILYLHNYNGGRIQCMSPYALNIHLESGDNVITFDATDFGSNAYGIVSSGELYIGGSGNLSINIDKTDALRSATGIGAPTLTIGGNVAVKVDMEGVTRASVKGINTSKSFRLEDGADLNVRMMAIDERPDSVYGIYADSGEIVFDSVGQTLISIASMDTNLSHYAIYNAALRNDFTNNGDISFTGAGKVELVNTGSGYADGIFAKFQNEEPPSNQMNDDGVILFSGCNVEIAGFAHSVWNQSTERATDDADIIINNDAKLNIHSDYDSFAEGLVSQKNGVLIDGADFTYEGTDYPVNLSGTSGFYNYSKFGFDVIGESHVNIYTSSHIHTGNDATSDFALTGDGYFKYMDLEGNFPTDFGSGNFFVKLAGGTQIRHPRHFILDGSYGTSSDGGIKLGHYSGYDDDIIEFVAYGVASPANVEVNGHAFTDTNLYYVNNADATTSDPTGYNAKFDKDAGILYLNGYEGGVIGFTNFDGATLRIIVEADSEITVEGYRSGIDVRGSGSLEIFSNNFSDLIINVTNAGYVDAISIQDGHLAINGSVHMDIYGTNTDANNGIVFGINAGFASGDYQNDVIIEDDARLRIYTESAHTANNGYQPAVYCKGTLHINLDSDNHNTIVFNTANVTGDSYSVIASYYEFVKYENINFYWSKVDGDYYGPTQSGNLNMVTNGAVNINENNCTATVEYGTAYHIDVIGGFCSNAAQGNYVEDAVAYVTAPNINDLTFQGWTSKNGSEFLDASARYGQFPVTQADVVTAHFDFVEKAPWFDTRGATDDTGYIGYEFKGTTSLLRLYKASDDSMVYNGFSASTKFTASSVPNGTYYIGAWYVAQDGNTYELRTSTFTVDYSAPALDYNVTLHCGAHATGNNVIVHTHGSYELPECTFTPDDGYRFSYWAFGNESGSSYTSFTVYADVDFYAVFEVIPTHTMTYTGGTGYVSGEMTPQEAREGQNYSFPAPTFIHEPHMEFDYWEVGSNQYHVGDVLLCEGDVTAYAVYKYLPTHTMTFNAGEGSGSMSNIVKYEDESFVLPACTFTAPENYEFSHWLVGGVEKQPGDEIAATSNYDVVAVYSRIKVTVTFSSGEGSGADIHMENVGMGTSITLPACTFTAPEGYRFSGWKMAGNTYDAGASVQINGSVTFTAQYELIPTHTVTFAAGEHGTGSMDPVVKQEGSSYVLPESTFTPSEGYVFKCWSVGGVEKNPGDSITITTDVTITAIYQRQYVVTFAAGEGGTGTMAPINVAEGNTYVLPTCTFTAPEGKQFDGWMVDGVKHNAGETITVTADTTVTAVWKDIPVTPVEPDTPATPEAPAKKGLSGGAIAAIVIVSVLVLGIGGFALVWFVILKKTFADFVAIFKKK